MGPTKYQIAPLALFSRYGILALLTVVLLAMVVVSLWMVALFVHFAGVYPGFKGEGLNLGVYQDIFRIRQARGVMVSSVDSNSSAERAGIKDRDLIVAVNGTRLQDRPQAFYQAFAEAKLGEEMQIDVISNGVSKHLVLPLKKSEPGRLSWYYVGLPIRGSATRIGWILYLPWLMLQALFLVVGAVIGWSRIKAPIPFQCSLLFLCSGIAIFLIDTPFLASWPSWALVLVLFFQNLASGLVLPLALRVLSVFPNPTRLGRVLWKWQWAGFLFFGLYFFSESADDFGSIFGGKSSWVIANPLVRFFSSIDQWLVLIFFGLAALLLVAQRIETRDHPRVRLKVIEFGFLLGAAGTVVFLVLRPLLFGVLPESWRSVYGFVMLFLTLILFSGTPLSFAYAILVRKTFGIRFIVRKGLQHLLLSRVAFLVEGIIVFFVAREVITHAGTSLSNSLTAVSGLAVGSSLVVIAALSRVNRKVMPALDRRFFREVYDVRRLLLDLSQQFSQLKLPERILRQTAAAVLKALHPSRVVLFLREKESGIFRCELALENGHSRLASLEELEREAGPVCSLVLKSEDSVIRQLERGKTEVEVYPEDLDSGIEEEARLIGLDCELLVPVPGNSGVMGVMGLGAKLSEEPFSAADKELLLTVARQLGLALENAQLLVIAKREAELSRDLEIARQVQQNLFPKELPTPAGWEFAGICRPARAVGGDYYDIFELSGDRVVVALGDVSGKGLGASLLMANVHAAIRSMAGAFADGLTGLTEELNRRLLSETAPEDYLTLFLGSLDLDTGELTYVNCGHPPPVLTHRKQRNQEMLTIGGPILGILDKNVYEQGSCQLNQEDVLVIFSDGVTEARNDREEMFEEKRLLQQLSETSGLEASAILDRMLKSVDGFTAGTEQADDISLVVVRRKTE
ncbi:MAG: SpoIIE family protein phosphatase [Candidatus Zixiibacteriota bacterium]